MKITKLLILSTTLLTLFSCGSQTETSPNYGDKIEENLSEVIPIDDKYRNYYEIFVGSFNDSNNDKMGDLNGVTSKLDYIKDLGYNGIWLMPIFKSSSYHKYNADNYYEIDPDYGTKEDLINLIEEAHKRDIRIILDLAINHASFNNPLYIKSREAYNKFINNLPLNEEENNYKDLFAFKEDSTSIKGRRFTSAGKYNFCVEENFSGGGMPEFNFESNFTIEVIKDIMKYYLELGIDGFRLDAVKYCFLNEIDKNINLLSNLYNYSKTINKDVYFVGECWDSEQIISQYYNSDIDSYFAFQASTSGNGFITRSINLDGEMRNIYLDGAINLVSMSKEKIPAPFLDNHDVSRVARAGNIKATKFFYGLLSMLNGTTFTYYGDEVGMNGTVPSDLNVRGYMNWSSDKSKNCNSPMGLNFDYPFDPVDKQINDQNSILNYYKKANYLRNKFKAISRGEILDSSKCIENTSLINLDKSYKDEKISIIINFSSKNYYNYNYKNTSFNEVSGLLEADINTYIGKIGNKEITLPPYSIAILK